MLIEFRWILIKRLGELHGLIDKNIQKISDGASVTEAKRIKRKTKEIEDIVKLNNEFLKLVEKCI